MATTATTIVRVADLKVGDDIRFPGGVIESVQAISHESNDFRIETGTPVPLFLQASTELPVFVGGYDDALAQLEADLDKALTELWSVEENTATVTQELLVAQDRVARLGTAIDARKAGR